MTRHQLRLHRRSYQSVLTVKRRKVDVMTTLLEKLVSQNAEAEIRKLEAEERREKLQQELMLAIICELRR